jgi:hypothetical protein
MIFDVALNRVTSTSRRKKASAAIIKGREISCIHMVPCVTKGLILQKMAAEERFSLRWGIMGKYSIAIIQIKYTLNVT